VHWNDDALAAGGYDIPRMSDFRKLLVWQKAHALSLDSATFARLFTAKRSGLADQITRAADAIPSHIAEGRGSSTDRDFARYVTMAIKEANELESHLQRAVDSGLCSVSEHAERTAATVEVRKMLIGLRKRLLQT
jgi:four helix bundle protein